MTSPAAPQRGDALFGFAHPAALERPAHLRVDLPGQAVAIDAPAPWLALLMQADEEAWSLDELRQQAGTRLGATDFPAFVDELLARGAASAVRPGHGRPQVEFFQDSVGTQRAIGRATVRWPYAHRTEGWGRGPDAARAGARALGEAVERHAFAHPRTDWRVARGSDVQQQEALAAFAPYLAAQYRQPGLGLQPYRPADERCWLPTTCLFTGARRWIPAEAIHPGAALPPTLRQRRCIEATTSGFACAPTFDAAVDHALHELIERDAFMRHWMQQDGGIALLREGLPAPVDAAAAELEAAGCQVHLQWLTRGRAPAWLALVRHAGLGFTTAGAAAGRDAAEALDRALAEAHALALARLASDAGTDTDTDEPDPTLARTPAQHAQVHGHPAHFHRAASLLRCRDAVPWAEAERRAAPRAPLDTLAGLGLAASVIDCTEGSRVRDGAGLPLHTVRVVAPGLVPLTFGAASLPLAFGPAAPGADFPHPLA